MGEPRSRRTLLQPLRNLLRRFRRRPSPPSDPYADRLVPVRSGPHGRSGAAVAEPPEDSYREFRPRQL